MRKFFSLFTLLLVIVSCSEFSLFDYLGDNIKLWKETEIWDFAKSVSKNDFKKAEEILSRDNIDVDYREPKFGETLLTWAVLNENFEAVKFLVEHGADPNSHDTYNGESPMTAAAAGFRSLEILRYLLLHGGNPNDYVKEDEKLTYRSIETPLTQAACLNLEMTKLLVEAGADPNFAVEPGITPFTKAALWTNMDILEYLLLNCSFDYKKTYIVTIDKGDTLFLKQLIQDDEAIYQTDSIRQKRLIKFIDEHFPEAK